MRKKFKKSLVFCVDFDGTCVTHSYPNLGHEIGAVKVLKALVEKGHKLILWTMRCDDQKEVILGKEHDNYKIHGGDFLTQAVEWFASHEIPLYSKQRNPSQDIWTTSPKCYADYYIDDAALGVPLKFNEELSDRPYVDWDGVETILKANGII